MALMVSSSSVSLLPVICQSPSSTRYLKPIISTLQSNESQSGNDINLLPIGKNLKHSHRINTSSVWSKDDSEVTRVRADVELVQESDVIENMTNLLISDNVVRSHVSMRPQRDQICNNRGQGNIIKETDREAYLLQREWNTNK